MMLIPEIYATIDTVLVNQMALVARPSPDLLCRARYALDNILALRRICEQGPQLSLIKTMLCDNL